MSRSHISLADLPPKYQDQAAKQLHNLPAGGSPKHADGTGLMPNASPIRQKRRGSASKLQLAFQDKLEADKLIGQTIFGEVFTLEIANGCKYRPDCWRVTLDLQRLGDGDIPFVRLDAWEVKGAHFWNAARVKLKVAARAYPFISFFLVTRPGGRNGQWEIERVMP